MKCLFLGLVLVAKCALPSDLYAEQKIIGDDTEINSGQPMPFPQVVKEYFSQWDINGDGKLSKNEIAEAMASQKLKDKAAAAMVAIEIVVRGNKYKLSPITEDYLISSPSREPTSADEGLGSADDDSKPEHFNHPPAFEPRYATALRKLRRTSRELFPQNLPSFEATHQGMLGDCPFVSTVGAMVYRNPAAVKAMVTQNDNGTFTVTLGGGRIIKINSLTDADIALWSSAGTNGLWFTVLEKAYRRILLTSDPKMHQKVLDIDDKFSSSKTIEILDGHQTRKVEIRNIRMSSAQLDGLRKELVAALREHLLVKARTPAGTKIRGITPDHEYAILGYYRDTDLVRVWNPHGNNFTPKGPDGLQNGYTTRTGEFDIPLKDLLQIFSDLTFETHIAVRN